MKVYERNLASWKFVYLCRFLERGTWGLEFSIGLCEEIEWLS